MMSDHVLDSPVRFRHVTSIGLGLDSDVVPEPGHRNQVGFIAQGH
jgi:hypothetical protein